jgi:hypothetical protein
MNIRKRARALQTLLHPESMGTQFHYLVLSKGIGFASRLSGFQFARDPNRVLFGRRIPRAPPSKSERSNVPTS